MYITDYVFTSQGVYGHNHVTPFKVWEFVELPWSTLYKVGLTSRVANSPVFPGTSRISAHVSRVPAYAFPGRKMSRDALSYIHNERDVVNIASSPGAIFWANHRQCKYLHSGHS